MSDFYVERLVKARKAHTCLWCGKAISVGEIYANVAGKFEGQFEGRCECKDCNALITYLYENDIIPYGEAITLADMKNFTLGRCQQCASRKKCINGKYFSKLAVDCGSPFKK